MSSYREANQLTLFSLHIPRKTSPVFCHRHSIIRCFSAWPHIRRILVQLCRYSRSLYLSSRRQETCRHVFTAAQAFQQTSTGNHESYAILPGHTPSRPLCHWHMPILWSISSHDFQRHCNTSRRNMPRYHSISEERQSRESPCPHREPTSVRVVATIQSGWKGYTTYKIHFLYLTASF